MTVLFILSLTVLEIKMLSKKEVLTSPKKGHALKENLTTQPFRHQPVFGNPSILSDGWYIICPQKSLKKEQVKSFNIVNQRIALFRGKNGKISCLDAFCPHLGADLGNGVVKDNTLKCLFHKWEFSSDGQLISTPCNAQKRLQASSKLTSYPVKEQFGFIWVFPSKTPSHKVPNPSFLENFETSYLFLKKVQLKVHPHILMLNAVDLQHFKTLHGINADISYESSKLSEDIIKWKIKLKLKPGKLITNLVSSLFGNEVNYHVTYAGGTITAISVKVPGGLFKIGPSLPSINILWASKPNKTSTGSIYNFLLIKKYQGPLPFRFIKKLWAYTVSFCVLMVLKDDDIYVFPNMRFFVKNLSVEDKSLMTYVKHINSLNISSWSDHET